MKILIGNGHGSTTPGKRSPDGRLMEWAYNREIARRIVSELKSQGYDAELVVPEDGDISLGERANRVNAWCNRLGTANIVFVSVHVNAAGGGSQWMNASGWSVWVAPNASKKSKELAKILYTYAEKYGLKGNRSVPVEKYWVGDFTVLTKTKCPAVLTENMFQDNKKDVEYLLTEKGKSEIVDIHVKGLKDYVAKYGGGINTGQCTCTCHK